jgi:hypothetical protein
MCSPDLRANRAQSSADEYERPSGEVSPLWWLICSHLSCHATPSLTVHPEHSAAKAKGRPSTSVLRTYAQGEWM